MVFHRSEDPATSSLPSSNVSIPVSQASNNTSPAPISFAAVAAAAAKKDAKRQQPPSTNSVPASEPTAPASTEFHHEEPVTSTSPATVDQAQSKDVFYRFVVFHSLHLCFVMFLSSSLVNYLVSNTLSIFFVILLPY